MSGMWLLELQSTEAWQFFPGGIGFLLLENTSTLHQELITLSCSTLLLLLLLYGIALGNVSICPGDAALLWWANSHWYVGVGITSPSPASTLGASLELDWVAMAAERRVWFWCLGARQITRAAGGYCCASLWGEDKSPPSGHAWFPAQYIKAVLECLMCFQRARGCGWLEKVSSCVGRIKCLCLGFYSFSPLVLGRICSFVDSKVERWMLWAAPAVSFSQGM